MTPLLLGLFAGLFGLGGQEVRHFENRAAADLRSRLSGPGAQVKVRARFGPQVFLGDVGSVSVDASRFRIEELPFFTEPDRPQSGRVRNLRLRLHDFVLRGLPIHDLRASLPDCRFDFGYALQHGRLRLSHSGTGEASVEILDHDLEPFILRKYPSIDRVRVRIAGGEITAEGHGKILLLDADFRVVAKVGIEGATRLVLTDAAVTLNGQPAAPATAALLLRTLNPVLDLNQDLHLRDAVRIRRVELREGELEAAGDGVVPDAPRPGM